MPPIEQKTSLPFIAIAALAAVFAAWVVIRQSQTVAPQEPLAAKENGRGASALKSAEPKIMPIQSAGGKVVSFSGNRLVLSTFKFVNADYKDPAAREERAVLVNAETKVFLVQLTADGKKLKRVPASASAIRAGGSVTVRTSGDFAKAGEVTAAQIDVIPSGTPLLPFE